MEKHKYESKISLSLFAKLTKYLYVNTALILLLNSFDFGDNFLSNTFSNRRFPYLSFSWHKSVGLNIFFTLILQLVYVNFRPTL